MLSVEELLSLPKQQRIISPEDGFTCSQEYLLLHIVQAHFRSTAYGVPRYDMDLAKHRGFSLQPMVDAGTAMILMSDERINKRHYDWTRVEEGTPNMSTAPMPQRLRVLIAKSITYAESLERVTVNWSNIHEKVKATQCIPNFSHDTRRSPEGLPFEEYCKLAPPHL